jgi:homoserine acetyltransferase
MAALLPGRPDVHVVRSLYGHDAFLIESEQVAGAIRAALKRTV